jgi:putative oxidoreductase
MKAWKRFIKSSHNSFMVEKIKESFPLVGRVLIGGMFFVAGIQKVTGFDGMVGFAASVGMPYPTVAIALAVLIEIGAGAMVILGWRIRDAALALAVFTVVATYYFHSNLSDQMQMILFTKNAAILGGLLYVASFGAGRFAVSCCGNCAGCDSCKS